MTKLRRLSVGATWSRRFANFLETCRGSTFNRWARTCRRLIFQILRSSSLKRSADTGVGFSDATRAWRLRRPMSGKHAAMRFETNTRGSFSIVVSEEQMRPRAFSASAISSSISLLKKRRNLPASFARVDGLAAPLLIVTVEDEVTGTGALVHRLIFGVTEKEGQVEILRDWELLQVLNALAPRSSPGAMSKALESRPVVERLKKAFDANLSAHAPTLHRPVSWPEMLLIPETQTETKLT